MHVFNDQIVNSMAVDMVSNSRSRDEKSMEDNLGFPANTFDQSPFATNPNHEPPEPDESKILEHLEYNAKVKLTE